MMIQSPVHVAGLFFETEKTLYEKANLLVHCITGWRECQQPGCHYTFYF
jgi:hypothetical protein